jgi:hypothetical protein
MAREAYRCKHCGSEKVLDQGTAIPDCCGERMSPIPLDDCTHPFSSEGARVSAADDACDDGVR